MTPTIETLKIHRIISGPYHSFDVITDGEDDDYDDDFYFAECLIETSDGEMSQEELRSDDLDFFNDIKSHMSKSIDPFVVEMEYWGYDDE